MDARKTAEKTARLSYGKLLSYLASCSRDLAAAEDALSEAFASALESWPVHGVPVNPEAWLTTAARRKLIDKARRRTVERTSEGDVSRTWEQLLMDAGESATMTFKDERLKLLFVCAHPAIDESVRTPLMLQTILGVDAGKIASCFVVSPASMSKRLVRAKSKIRDAGIPFEVPDAHELPIRVSSVLEAIYAAYGSGWDNGPYGDGGLSNLTEEAIWLARLTSELLKDDPEVKGLLALMLFCESRRNSRRSAEGQFIPLDEQRVEDWNAGLIVEAEKFLWQAARNGTLGRFQLEAAIQSAHIARRKLGINNWKDIVQIYDGLVRFFPTYGSLIGRAAAVMEAYGAELALDLLNGMDQDKISDYQPFWALIAEVNRRLGRNKAAKAGFMRAAGLSTDEATRHFLLNRAKEEADEP